MNLQFAILGMLSISPMNGYYLKRIFDHSVNYFWSASLSQIYRELGVLEKKGFVISQIVEQDDRPDKKMYEITPAGRQAFLEWVTHFPEVLSTVKRDELSLRIFFGSWLGKAGLKQLFERFIEERKKMAEAMLQDKKDIVKMTATLHKANPEQELCMRFISRRAQMSNQMLIQWAEECIRDLEQIEENMEI